VDVEHGFMGATGVVGGNLPLALGTALSAHLRGSDQVTVVFFGDGAVQAGHFNETINLAALWKLPVIFVCENNGFAEFTSRAEHSTIERVSDVVAPYGFERQTVSGSDVPAVYEVFSEFVSRARSGSGPFLLECLTYRRRGHYEGDQQKYRDPAAEQEWAERDPIARLTERCVDPDAAAEIEREAAAEIDAAVAFARDSPFPDPAIMADLVYAASG
jgi:TPP-dependent pyruvate/acetoin dehydrogenase alpha subunit